MGLVLLVSVIVPIGLSQLSFSLRPRLLDPTAVALVPVPFVASVLGITTPDYTQSTTWFPASSSTPTVSRVRYYTLSIPKLGLRDVPVEINGTDLKKMPFTFLARPFLEIMATPLFLAILLYPLSTNLMTPFPFLILSPKLKSAMPLPSNTTA